MDDGIRFTISKETGAWYEGEWMDGERHGISDPLNIMKCIRGWR